MDTARPDPSPVSSPAGPLVLDLSGTGTAPLKLVGGKALNLGKLLAAGLPVPRGFCLTTVAYELAEPPGLAALAAELDAPRPGAGTAAYGAARGTGTPGTAAPVTAAGRARALIEDAPIPPAVDAAVRTAYADMGGTLAVAVRSSATAEDLPFASFAGQQDGAAGRPSGATGRWRTGPPTGSATATWDSPSSSRPWSTPPRPECCSPPTLSPEPGPRRSSMRARARGRPWSRERSTRTSSCWTRPPARSGFERREGRSPAAARSWTSPGCRNSRRWETASSDSSGRPRISNGRSTPPAGSGSPSHARSPHCIHCPSPRPKTSPPAPPRPPGCTCAAPCSRG